MDELITWLRAQLDGDEAAANAMQAVFPAPWDVVDHGASAIVRADEPDFRIVTEIEQWAGMPKVWLGEVIAHIARQDPAHTLRRIAAERAIVAEMLMYLESTDGEWGCGHTAAEIAAGLCMERRVMEDKVIRYLALPYADRPGYREEWRP